MATELLDQTRDTFSMDVNSMTIWMRGVLATLEDRYERSTAYIRDAEGRDLSRIRAERVELSDGSHVVNFILTFAE